MPIWMKPVFSSMISEVGYDTDAEELLVKFVKNGKTAAYKGASEGLAMQLSNAPSAGQMFLSEVKPFYQDFRYV
jgi:hypothetical protein